jgi:hypothetical protein
MVWYLLYGTFLKTFKFNRRININIHNDLHEFFSDENHCSTSNKFENVFMETSTFFFVFFKMLAA